MTQPRPVGVPSTVLDVLAVIALVGCVLMAGLGALLVLLSGEGVVVVVATLTALVAGIGSASGVHLVHRAWACHEVAARPSRTLNPWTQRPRMAWRAPFTCRGLVGIGPLGIGTGGRTASRARSRWRRSVIWFGCSDLGSLRMWSASRFSGI